MDPSMMQNAMNMMNTMSPDQRRAAAAQAASMDPDAMLRQAAAARGTSAPSSGLSATQKYQLDGATRIKEEGNKLHGLKQYKQASDKYNSALTNVTSLPGAEAAALRTSCHSNLASCYLQLNQWDACVRECDAVIATDSSNRKALYRRGQAYCSLGRADAAVKDLKRALELSPESEKPLIKEKLDEAQQAQRHAARGVVVEEVTEDAGEARGAADNGHVEGLVEEEDTDDDMPGLEGTTAAPTAPAAAAPPHPAGPAAGQMAYAAEMMKRDPEQVRRAAEAMASMSDAELAAQMAAAGGAGGMGLPAGATPEMARAAAAMMKNMSPDQIAEMADKAASAGMGMPGPAAMPSDPAAAAAQAAEMIKNDPNALKNMAKMMEAMPAEQLEAMASSMPGAPPGMKMDPAQIKMAAKMMETMSPEDLERMTKMAASMGMAAPGMGAPTATAVATAAGPSEDAGGAAAVAPPMAPGSVPGAAPRFDPGSVPPGMMARMRRQMADPEMLRGMQSMIKGMDPETLASMIASSGMQMTPEQAKKMVDQMGNLSDTQVAWISRLMAAVNAVMETYARIKAWAAANRAQAIAVLLLLAFLFLRWLGWM